MYTLPILSALIPAIVLLIYIYWKDRHSPEPTRELVKATLFGVLSIILSLCMSLPLMAIGAIPKDVQHFLDAMNHAFLGAAIPEELAKLFVLWLFLRKNIHFDERMDGIVYAVCVSLGFAGLENVMYIVGSYIIGDTEWLTIALSRAVTAVPAHFCFGVLMGYFYSLAHFSSKDREWNVAMTFIAPIIAHGIYDIIPLTFRIEPPLWLSAILVLVFIALCFYLWRVASKAIKAHLTKMGNDATTKFYDNK